jgi:hypothetical protein
MFGFNSVPGRSTRWSNSSPYTAWSVRLVASKQASIVWSPSIMTSGSTMGTMPVSWQSAA